MLEDIERLKGETSVRVERYTETIEKMIVHIPPKDVFELG